MFKCCQYILGTEFSARRHTAHTGLCLVLDVVKSLEWLHIPFKLPDTTHLKNIFCFLGIMIHFKKFRLQEKLKALK